LNAEPSSLVSQALEAYHQGKLEDAIRLFESAHGLEADPARRAELANNLSVSYLKFGRSQEALSIVRGTGELFSKLGDIQRAAQATGNLAAALEATGNLPSKPINRGNWRTRFASSSRPMSWRPIRPGGPSWPTT